MATPRCRETINPRASQNLGGWVKVNPSFRLGLGEGGLERWAKEGAASVPFRTECGALGNNMTTPGVRLVAVPRPWIYFATATRLVEMPSGPVSWKK